MPSHNWRPRPPHPCGNPACIVIHTLPAKDCARCARRMERHGKYELIIEPPKICITPACRSRVKAFDRCMRCDRLWKKGFNPDSYIRPYRRLCMIEWCPEYACGDRLCPMHLFRLRQHNDVRWTRGGRIETIPVHCIWPECDKRIKTKGLCLEHLHEKSRSIILLREFLPSLPGHKIRYCIGKPGCKRNAILFGRCPDCLYDWQFSLRPHRNFFKVRV